MVSLGSELVLLLLYNPSLDNRLKAENFHRPQIRAKLQLKELIPNVMHLLIIGSGYEDDLKIRCLRPVLFVE